MTLHVPRPTPAVVLIASLPRVVTCIATEHRVGLYSVHEVVFDGPTCDPTDAPARDIEMVTRWRHEDGGPGLSVHGFRDGDGRGGASGNVFKVRSCPIKEGSWTLVETKSNAPELAGQKQGYRIECTASSHPGFWIVDTENAGGRWYQRSDGSHPYIYGNTMYSFLSETNNQDPTGGTVSESRSTS